LLWLGRLSGLGLLAFLFLLTRWILLHGWLWCCWLFRGWGVRRIICGLFRLSFRLRRCFGSWFWRWFRFGRWLFGCLGGLALLAHLFLLARWLFLWLWLLCGWLGRYWFLCRCFIGLRCIFPIL
jgi:hypothetical protein